MKLTKVKNFHAFYGIHFLGATKVFYKDDNWAIKAYSGPHGYIDYGAEGELFYNI